MKPRPPANAAPPGGVWQLTQLPASARYLPRAAGESAAAGAGAPAGAAPGAFAAGVGGLAAGVAGPVPDPVPAAVPESAAATEVISTTLPGQPAMRSPASSHVRGRPVRFTLTFSPLLREERAILHRRRSRAAAYVLSDGGGTAQPVSGSYCRRLQYSAGRGPRRLPRRVLVRCFCSWRERRERYTFRSI